MSCTLKYVIFAFLSFTFIKLKIYQIGMDNIKNIVFDLGGVIITLDHERAVKRFLEIGVDNARELLDPYHQKGIFLDLEEGKLSRENFYDALRKESGKNISNENIDYGWFGFLKETPDYKLEMLEQLKKQYNLFLLSNTNPIIMSWARTADFSGKGKKLDDYFDKLYLSYEIGITKPNKRIFDYLIADSGIKPEETLFIDDGVANIEAGKALGMKTYRPENGEDFRGIFE
ncbi:D-ribitol-5-phosphate phosphatase [Bacteroidia bacterium]|nr:D-ribitol-5-phosphate phosphatase [Bacteroidia bacterium]GHV20056.1 D-ribitol-5-phosphate phosphatase [Bacteroidia bacterium]